MFPFQYSDAAASAKFVSAFLFAAVGCASATPTYVSKSGYALHSRASGIDGGCALYDALYQLACAFHQCARTWTRPCCACERYDAFELFVAPEPAAGTASTRASSVATRVSLRTDPFVPCRSPAHTSVNVKRP